MRSACLFLLLLCLTSLRLEAAKTKSIYIKVSIDMNMDEDSKNNLKWRLEKMFEAKLRDAFSCIEVLTEDAFSREIQALRQEALNGESGSLSSLSNRLCNYNFLLAVNISQTSTGLTSTSANLNQLRPVRNYGSKFLSGKNSDPYNLSVTLANQLIDEASENELCPYTGTLTAIHKSERKYHEENSSEVTNFDPMTLDYCTGTQVTALDIQSSYEARWELLRQERGAALGQLNCELQELLEESDENNCYTCSSGRFGGRTWNRTTLTNFSTSKISSQSESDQNDINDTRINIKFYDNDTYMIFIKSTSTYASNCTLTIQEMAKGSCDSVNDKETKHTSKSVWIDQKLGPFQGGPTDKTLSGKGQIQLIPSVEGETSTLEFEFSFSR